MALRNHADNEIAAAALMVLTGAILKLDTGVGSQGSAVYGTDYKNDVFYMTTESGHEALQDSLEASGHEFQEGEEPPYFEHYESGLQCWYYKHLNRSFYIECPEGVSISQVLIDCLESLSKSTS